MIADNFLNHVTGGVEGIAGLHGEYWVRLYFWGQVDELMKNVFMDVLNNENALIFLKFKLFYKSLSIQTDREPFS